MNIRAHHLLVWQGIIERGGRVSHIPASKFRAEWRKVYREFMQPGSKIIFTNSLDDICLACLAKGIDKGKESCPDNITPSLNGANWDDVVIEEFGFHYGVEYHGEYVLKRIQESEGVIFQGI